MSIECELLEMKDRLAGGRQKRKEASELIIYIFTCSSKAHAVVQRRTSTEREKGKIEEKKGEYDDIDVTFCEFDICVFPSLSLPLFSYHHPVV